MSAPCNKLASNLITAVDKFALGQARLTTAELTNCVGQLNGGIENDTAKELLVKLLKRRWFDVADPLADTFSQIPSASAELKRRCAQVMLERCRYGPALKILLGLVGNPDTDQAEVLGHIGRIRKQQYLESIEQDLPDTQLLTLATSTYLNAYEQNPSRMTWHGINAVALLRHYEALPGLASITGNGRNSSQLAQAILATVSSKPARKVWDLATAAEAALALGDYGAAAAWLGEYIRDPGADAFELGSTLRQFDQIWRIADLHDPLAFALLDLLRAALLEKTSANVQVTAEDIKRIRTMSVELEAVFGADRFDSLENYRRGLDRCGCVARIGRTAEIGVGTGFIVPAGLLGLKPEAAFVLVTNAHVISEAESERAQGALHPSEVVVTFAAMPGIPPNREFHIREVLYSSGREVLDVTVARLSSELPPELATYPMAPVLPARGSKTQVRVIGHPSGRGLSFSVNELLDHESPRIHYRTATEGGSSGSPVFNQEWKLIALHHAGGQAVPMLNGQGTAYQANEGIWIGAIRQGIEQYRVPG